MEQSVERTDGESPDAVGEPSPENVAPIGADEGVYQRDADGNLRPETEVVEWNGQHRQFTHLPIPVGDLDEFQSMGVDVEMEDLAEVLAGKVTEPDRTTQEWLDTDPSQFNAILGRLTEKATGDRPSNEFHEQVQAELEERADSGN